MSSLLKKPGTPDASRTSGGEMHLTRVTATMPDGSVMVASPGAADCSVLAKLCGTVDVIGVGDTVVALFFPLQDAVVLSVVEPAGGGGRPALTVNGNRLIVRGHDEIELCCGRASIRLQADGKIVIDGETIISRATRTNSIEGAAVKIN